MAGQKRVQRCGEKRMNRKLDEWRQSDKGERGRELGNRQGGQVSRETKREGSEERGRKKIEILKKETSML